MTRRNRRWLRRGTQKRKLRAIRHDLDRCGCEAFFDGRCAFGFVFVGDGGDELIERHGAQVFLCAKRSDGDGLRLGVAGADDEEVGDLHFGTVFDFGLDALVVGVAGRADADGFELGEDLGGVVVALFGDGEDADLFGGEPDGEGAGEVFDEDAYESFH